MEQKVYNVSIVILFRNKSNYIVELLSSLIK